MDNNSSIFSIGVVMGVLVTLLISMFALLPAYKAQMQHDAVQAGVGQYNQTNGHFEWKSAK